MRKAFTMIELLFVLALVSALMFISFNNINIQNSSINYSLKQNAKTFKSALDKYYTNYFSYKKFKNGTTFKDTNDDGSADKGGVNNDGKLGGEKVYLMNLNKIYLKGKSCNNDGNYNGYYFKVYSNNSKKAAEFDSCKDAKIHFIINK